MRWLAAAVISFRRAMGVLLAIGLLGDCVAAEIDATLARDLAIAAPRADRRVLGLAVTALACAERGVLNARRLVVIDYSLRSTLPRLWLFDLETRRLLLEEHVAHGKGSGEDHAFRFSNEPGSLQSSLGLFRTTETYMGRHGYSLRLEGLEPGINDRASERAIVMHGAPYVSDEAMRQLGRLGRSGGCPAIRMEIAADLIDEIRGGQYLFAYYPDREYLASSSLLACPDERADRGVARSLRAELESTSSATGL